MTVHSLTVPGGVSPQRLDVFLARAVPDCSRRIAQRTIGAGHVKVNGRRARKGDLVKEGDLVLVPAELVTPVSLQPNADLAIDLLYADDAVVAVDKPAGMPSHALRAEETRTVANFLLSRYPEMGQVGRSPLESGLVHRLDTGTSGVLLSARTASAFSLLRQQFTTGLVEKIYTVLVQGEVRAAGEVRSPIEHAPHNRRKMRIVEADRPGGRPAHTTYRPLEHCGAATLLEVRIHTGVMHQIRVHLASIGHPVVGDALYGSAPLTDTRGRHLLHASALGFVHPQTGQRTDIRSPLPANFKDRLLGC